MKYQSESLPQPKQLSRRLFLTGCFAASTVTLSGCTPSQIRRSINTGQKLYQGNISGAITSQIPGTGIAVIDQAIRSQINKLLSELAKTWGEERIATPKEYVKYTDHFNSRAIINFTSGYITVETVVQKNAKTALKKAIISTLLMPTDPSKVDLLTAKEIPVDSTPFLHELVVDQEKQAIRYEWRASRFADYLIGKHYQTSKVTKGANQGATRHSVQFEMVRDYQGKQQHRYQASVMRQAKRFHVEPALIYGIIETESAFNPFAMSHIPAYGLMQIVPTTAGRDVYRKLNNRDGIPSKNLLFNPDHNIEYGTAYLSILFNQYLNQIRDPQSKEYCVIAAYNTGAGNVLKTFASDRQQAFNKINRLSSQQVFNQLINRLPYTETRRYLLKVTRSKSKYQSV